MSTPDTTSYDLGLDDTLVDEEDWEIEPPARRRLPWLTLALAGAAVAALAFVGGILVEQRLGGGSSSAAGLALPEGFPGAPAGSAAGGRGGSTGTAGTGLESLGTSGQVSYIQGRTLYVTTANGNTVQVTVPKGLKISRTVKQSASTVTPGETVVVRGARATDGSVTATSVTVGTAGAGSGFPGFGG